MCDAPPLSQFNGTLPGKASSRRDPSELQPPHLPVAAGNHIKHTQTHIHTRTHAHAKCFEQASAESVENSCRISAKGSLLAARSKLANDSRLVLLMLRQSSPYHAGSMLRHRPNFGDFALLLEGEKENPEVQLGVSIGLAWAYGSSSRGSTSS